MAKNPVITRGSENRAAPDSRSDVRPILKVESGDFVTRLNDVLGTESVSSFSRRCGFKTEGKLRSYLNGSLPSIEAAAAIADAGGVTVDWLATGRLPKTRAEYRAQHAPPADPSAGDGRRDILEAVLRVMEYKIGHNQVDAQVIATGLAGAPSWLDAARGYPELEVRLRSAIATLEFIKAAESGKP